LVEAQIKRVSMQEVVQMQPLTAQSQALLIRDLQHLLVLIRTLQRLIQTRD
jgi:hypothetical protein